MPHDRLSVPSPGRSCGGRSIVQVCSACQSSRAFARIDVHSQVSAPVGLTGVGMVPHASARTTLPLDGGGLGWGDLVFPLRGPPGVGIRSLCPSPLAREGADGGCLVLTPILALPHRGGGERRAACTSEIPPPVSPPRGRDLTCPAYTTAEEGDRGMVSDGFTTPAWGVGAQGAWS
jgi:hypothetical protein